jgi:hypothetical protein
MNFKKLHEIIGVTIKCIKLHEVHEKHEFHTG